MVVVKGAAVGGAHILLVESLVVGSLLVRELAAHDHFFLLCTREENTSGRTAQCADSSHFSDTDLEASRHPPSCAGAVAAAALSVHGEPASQTILQASLHFRAILALRCYHRW